MSRCFAIAFATRERNFFTSSFADARCRSVSPASSSPSNSWNFSIAVAWLEPAFKSCPCSSSDTITSSRSPTSSSRARANTSRKSAARRGSVAAIRSARRRNVRSRSRNCRATSCSREASGGAAAGAGASAARATPDRQPTIIHGARP